MQAIVVGSRVTLTGQVDPGGEHLRYRRRHGDGRVAAGRLAETAAPRDELAVTA